MDHGPGREHPLQLIEHRLVAVQAQVLIRRIAQTRIIGAQSLWRRRKARHRAIASLPSPLDRVAGFDPLLHQPGSGGGWLARAHNWVKGIGGRRGCIAFRGSIEGGVEGHRIGHQGRIQIGQGNGAEWRETSSSFQTGVLGKQLVGRRQAARETGEL